MLGCLGGSQDFGEADTRFGAVRFLGEVLRISGRGMKGNWSGSRLSASPSPGRVSGYLGPTSASSGSGVAHAGPRSPVHVGPQLRAQHVHRLDAAPVLQPHRPLAQHLPRGAGPGLVLARAGPSGAPVAGEAASAAGGDRCPAHPYSAVGGRGVGGAVCRLLS